MWMMTSAREHRGWTPWEMEERGRMGQKKGVLGKGEFIVICFLYKISLFKVNYSLFFVL